MNARGSSALRIVGARAGAARRGFAFAIMLCVLAMLVTSSVCAAPQPAAGVVAARDDAPAQVIPPALMLADPGGALDIDEVKTSPHFVSFADRPRDLAWTTAWFAFAVTTTGDPRERWYLAVDEACTSATLYVPTTGNGYRRTAFDWSVPFNARAAAGVHPAVELPPAAMHGSRLYLRLTCQRNNFTALVATSAQLEVLAARAWSSWIAIFAILPFSCTLGVVFFAMTRERPYLLFALTYGFGSLLNMEFFGWLPRILPSLPNPPYVLLVEVFSLGVVSFQWLFARDFLQIAALSKRLDRGVSATFALFAAFDIASNFTATGVLLAVAFMQSWLYLLLIAAAMLAVRRGNRAAWFIAFGFAALATGFLAGHFASLGVVPRVFSFGPKIGTAIDMLLFFCAIANRLRSTMLERQRALAASEAAQRNLNEQQQRHIADIEARNHSFGRFVPVEFLERLGRHDIVDIMLGDHVAGEMTILFSDIRSFTTLAETLSPTETFELLNSYLLCAGPTIRASGGFVDKYIGDGIMALFPGPVSSAIEAALALHAELDRFNARRARSGYDPIVIGVGIHVGPLMMGTIGEPERLETTVISDAVNVASRMEGLTRHFGVGAIVSDAVVERLADPSAYHLRSLGNVALKGLNRPAEAYEVFDGDAADLLLHKLRTLDRYNSALSAFFNGEFATSADAFGRIAALDPRDGPAAYFRDRSARMRAQDIAHWDGILRLEMK